MERFGLSDELVSLIRYPANYRVPIVFHFSLVCVRQN